MLFATPLLYSSGALGVLPVRVYGRVVVMVMVWEERRNERSGFREWEWNQNQKV